MSMLRLSSWLRHERLRTPRRREEEGGETRRRLRDGQLAERGREGAERLGGEDSARRSMSQSEIVEECDCSLSFFHSSFPPPLSLRTTRTRFEPYLLASFSPLAANPSRPHLPRTLFPLFFPLPQLARLLSPHLISSHLTSHLSFLFLFLLAAVLNSTPPHLDTRHPPLISNTRLHPHLHLTSIHPHSLARPASPRSHSLRSPTPTKTAKIGSLVDVQASDDPEGMRVFYYLVQDLKIFIFSLISLHFKIKPTH